LGQNRKVYREAVLERVLLRFCEKKITEVKVGGRRELRDNGLPCWILKWQTAMRGSDNRGPVRQWEAESKMHEH
jgi:hypothetical protein